MIDRAEQIIAHPDDGLAILGRFAGRSARDIRSGAEPPSDPVALATLAVTLLADRTRYRDPFGGGTASAEQTIDLLGEWRRWLDQNRRIGVMSGMRGWKRARMRAFPWC